ncbi:MAG: hypothetical protein ACTSVU_01135 [Promethearchaeota archaeon]
MNLSESELKDWKMQFEPLINYESIVCANFPDIEPKINVSAMGVHFTSNNEVYLHTEKEHHTYDILKPGVKFSINFSEDLYEYTVAGLKKIGKEEHMDEFPLESFRTIKPVPTLKSAWCTVICEVIPWPIISLQVPPCRRSRAPNVRARVISVDIHRFPKIFNNRAFNLSLEALILTTKIPKYEKFSDDYNESLKRYLFIKKKLVSWHDMGRFENSFLLMDNYLIEHAVKPKELFNF